MSRIAALCVVGLVGFGCWALNSRSASEGAELLVSPAVAASPRFDPTEPQATVSGSSSFAALVETPARTMAVAEPKASEPIRASEPVTSNEAVTIPNGVIAGGVPPVETWREAARVEPEAPAEPARAAPQMAPESPPVPRPPLFRSSLRSAPASAPGRKSVPASFAALLQGTWAPQADACLDPEQSEFIPLVISKAKATAGEGTCAFVSKKREGRKWSVVAECSNGQSAWTSHIDLAVEAGVLTWASERGAQSYVRCQPTVVAKAAVPTQRTASRSASGKVARAAPSKKPATVRVVYGPGGGAPGVAVTHVR